MAYWLDAISKADDIKWAPCITPNEQEKGPSVLPVIFFFFLVLVCKKIVFIFLLMTIETFAAQK